MQVSGAVSRTPCRSNTLMVHTAAVHAVRLEMHDAAAFQSFVTALRLHAPPHVSVACTSVRAAAVATECPSIVAPPAQLPEQRPAPRALALESNELSGKASKALLMAVRKPGLALRSSDNDPIPPAAPPADRSPAQPPNRAAADSCAAVAPVTPPAVQAATPSATSAPAASAVPVAVPAADFAPAPALAPVPAPAPAPAPPPAPAPAPAPAPILTSSPADATSVRERIDKAAAAAPEGHAPTLVSAAVASPAHVRSVPAAKAPSTVADAAASSSAAPLRQQAEHRHRSAIPKATAVAGSSKSAREKPAKKSNEPANAASKMPANNPSQRNRGRNNAGAPRRRTTQLPEDEKPVSPPSSPAPTRAHSNKRNVREQGRQAELPAATDSNASPDAPPTSTPSPEPAPRRSSSSRRPLAQHREESALATPPQARSSAGKLKATSKQKARPTAAAKKRTPAGRRASAAVAMGRLVDAVPESSDESERDSGSDQGVRSAQAGRGAGGRGKGALVAKRPDPQKLLELTNFTFDSASSDSGGGVGTPGSAAGPLWSDANSVSTAAPGARAPAARAGSSVGLPADCADASEEEARELGEGEFAAVQQLIKDLMARPGQRKRKRVDELRETCVTEFEEKAHEVPAAVCSPPSTNAHVGVNAATVAASCVGIAGVQEDARGAHARARAEPDD